MSMIVLENVEKEYLHHGKKIPALRGVSLTIQNWEFSALAGPSGSGKTTLLNIIGGLDAPTAGSVIVDGTALTALSPRELADMRLRKIGFVFQAYNLIPVLSALENVEYVLLLQGLETKQRHERAEAVLTEVGLQDQIHRLPHELSGGQQQRVAVARAIVSAPAIVLADEPTANLDQKTGAMLMDIMHEMNLKKGITFLFSTHDPMVMERSERLIRLSDGNIVSDESKR